MPTKNPITIIGGGIVGAATAEALARRGEPVRLIEQFEPGHQQGSSHGDGRIIRLAYPEPLYLEMAQRSYRAWDELAARLERPFWRPSGGWDCGPLDSPRLAEVAANFERFNIPYERLSAAESNRRFPLLHLEPGSEAIYQADTGVLFATSAVQALWQAAQAAGAEMITGQRIEWIEARGGQLELGSASGERWRAARLILAAGGWTAKIAAQMGLELPLKVTQEQVGFFAPKNNLDHGPDALPVVIDHHPNFVFYALPQIEVPGVKAGWHHTGPVIDPDQPQPIDRQKMAAVEGFVARRFRHLETTPFQEIRCLYTSTPDHHFILDRHPEWPNVIIAAGFSGHGFKFGPVLGQILADLALDRSPPVPLEQFALSRLEQPAALEKRSGA